ARRRPVHRRLTESEEPTASPRRSPETKFDDGTLRWCTASERARAAARRHSEQRRDQVLDLQRQTRFHPLYDLAAVACLRVAAIAEKRDALAGLDQRDKLAEFGLRLMFLNVRVVDAHQRVPVAHARGLTSLGRRAELLQMHVTDAGLVEAGRKLALGEPGTA